MWAPRFRGTDRISEDSLLTGRGNIPGGKACEIQRIGTDGSGRRSAGEGAKRSGWEASGGLLNRSEPLIIVLCISTHEAMVGEAVVGVVPDDDVVQDLDHEQAGRPDEIAGKTLVF